MVQWRMTVTRRGLLLATGTGLLGIALAGCAPGSDTGGGASTQATGRWMMPDEGAPHAATWMALQADDGIWGPQLASQVRETLRTVAEAIARFEPVRALIAPGDKAAVYLAGVETIEHQVDDLWIRDTGPTFVLDGETLAGVDFNFNGWGDRQRHALDAKVAATVCEAAPAKRLTTDLVLEGGALEVDGEGTAIITESCVLNKNRNPGWTKSDVEAELARLLGIRKIIWLPGIAGKDITDGHTDFYARFASPGVVVAGREDDPKSFDYAVTRTHLKILKEATDAAGRRLEVHVIPGPATIRPAYDTEDFAAGYINFYVCNGAVILPEFGDEDADDFARYTLAGLFPDREMVQLNIDPIAAGGGGIHCATQQQPRSGA